MSEHLEFTGERFTPECEREIWYEHMHRYAFASRFCAGLHVLDAACGEGYGSAMLARVAGQVTGMDLSADTIAHAQARYQEHARLSFRLGDCTALPFPNGHFDCVVSFETIEHVAQQEAVLSEFRRVLKPSGFLLISSPDKAQYSDAQGTDNPFHIKELYREEFEELLAGQFPACRLLGQRLLFHSAIWAMQETPGACLQTLNGDNLISGGRIPHPPMYLLAVCAQHEANLPEPGAGLWLFDDAEESVYQHYLGEIRRNMSAGGIIAARDAEIADLRKALDARPAGRASWLGRLFRW